MGAPKQKWTAEEELALKAGVIKHGAGKWRTILKDPEFSGVLYTRSNVDLKDKWRNMSVMANGWGSREKAKTALRRMHQISKQDESSIPLSTTVQSDDEMMDAKPISVSSETQHISGPRKSIVRLDNLIMEAITRLKEPGGSNKTTIAGYIEVKRRYRIAPTPALSEKRRNTSMYPFEGRQMASAFEGRRMASPFEGRPMLSPFEGRYMASPKFENDEGTILMKAQIDLELAKMRTMTPREATLAAAQAVKEAEAAIAEAEEAAREAEAAEADAEAAQAFAEAAMKTLKGSNATKTMNRP
ncbi:telomere repeat-binding factor 1 isoform X3 [Pyrus x bretschneideri]|uniref:telomere repeat-binding factor 1 isoform X3 n=1 Tax=Pyrus x bretschneideri TaxID=225117 RepID=UPI00202DCF8F|nr:telomere repeat-binding factor 1 isoform X3 [Pyrus x bretschneideri]